jgi:hypothetical protein
MEKKPAPKANAQKWLFGNECKVVIMEESSSCMI